MKWRKKKLEKVIDELSDSSVGSSPYSRSVDFSTLLDKYDIVDVAVDNDSPYIIVSEKQASGGLSKELVAPDNFFTTYSEPSAQARANGASVAILPDAVPAQRIRMADLAGTSASATGARDVVNLNELGSSSPSPWISFARRDYNPDLVGHKGLTIYDKMRRNDGTVKGTLRAVKTPVLAARWFMVPCDKHKTADVNAANFVWKNLTQDMTIGWTQVIIESLLMCEFGYYMFELVWIEAVENGQDRIKLQKLAPRHPLDVVNWEYDAQGGVDGAWFYNDKPGLPNIFIPIDKLLVFTLDREAGDMTGMSILRSAYKHWYFIEQLYKIDAIQKERHGIGVPVIKLPPGFNESDKQLADQLGRNLRTNERAHIVMPPLWEIMFAEMKGQVVNALESVQEHKQAIRENILLQFMDPKKTANAEDQKMFLKSTRFIADVICETINMYLVPRIMDANFSRVGHPVLKARRIGESDDWRTLSFAVRNLIGCGAIIPDEKLEEWLRDEMDMPEADIATRRYIITTDDPNDVDPTPGEDDPNDPNSPENTDSTPPKQNGAKAGLPRQANVPSAPGMRKTAGRDNSGG